MRLIEVMLHPRGRALVNVEQVTFVVAAAEGATRVHFLNGQSIDVRHKLGEVEQLFGGGVVA